MTGKLPISRPFLVILFLHVAINIAALLFPFVREFSYENAVLNTFLLTLFTGLLTAQHRGVKSGLVKQLLVLWGYVPLQFAIICLFSYDACCPWFHGFKFYFTGTVPGIIIGLSFFLTLQILFSKWTKSIFGILVVLLTAIPLLEFYFLPQIKFYNPILFYYPGTIYDELILIDMALIAHRILSTGAFVLLYVLVRKYSPGKKVLLAGLGAFVFLYYLVIAPAFGFVTTERRLERSGYAKIESKNFIIYFPNTLAQEKVNVLAALHEFHFDDLKSVLKDAPKDKITSFIYANPDEKQRLFGSGSADVAKPWRNEIHTTVSSVYETLRHELAHIFAGTFANPPFYAAAGLNPLLIEGFATAMSPRYDELDIHELLKAGIKSENLKAESVKGISGFFGINTRLAYYLSGEFVRQLIQSHGIDNFKLLYQNGDYEVVYKRSFNSDFGEFINAYSDSGAGYDSALADYYFAQAPAFKRKCIRYTAELRHKTEMAFSDSNKSHADKYSRELLSLSHQRGDYFLRLRYVQQFETPDSALVLLNTLTGDQLKNDFILKMLSNDFLIKAGGKVKTDELESHLLKAPNLRLKAGILTRMFFNRSEKLGEYLTQPDSLKAGYLRNVLSDSASFLLVPYAEREENLTQLFYTLRSSTIMNEFTELAKLILLRKIIQSGKIRDSGQIILFPVKDKLPSGSKFEVEIMEKFLKFIYSDKSTFTYAD